MEEINIGDKIMFHVAGNHNIGYTKGKKYVGTVLSRDSRSRLHVRAKGMPRACIDERDVDKLIEESMDFDMDEVEEPTDDDWLNAVSNLFDSYTYDVKNTDVDKFKMSDVMNVYRIINL